MPSDLLVLDVAALPPLPYPQLGSAIRRIRRADRDDLARAYRGSCPPDTGAADLADTEAEIDASFAGHFGTHRYDASFVTEHGGRAVGAIVVTERSIWDENVSGPS